MHMLNLLLCDLIIIGIQLMTFEFDYCSKDTHKKGFFYIIFIVTSAFGLDFISL